MRTNSVVRLAITCGGAALLLVAWACNTQPTAEAGACEQHPLYGEVVANETLRVIITIDDADLSVAEAQQDILDALEGTEYELHRRPDNFPILALRVGESAFCRLVDHQRVEGIEEDVAVPPT